MMLSVTAAANDTFRHADPEADLDCGPYMPGPIGPSVILNAYNVYPFAHFDEVRLTSYPQSQTRALGETLCRPFYTARSRNSGYSPRSYLTCHCAST